MTALLKFIITFILGLLGFTTPVENEVVIKNYAPHDQKLTGIEINEPYQNCDNIGKNSCFLLK